MKHALKIIALSGIIGLLLFPLASFAKTPTVSLVVPENIQAGESFILEVKINHSGQSGSDYVDQIKITSNSEPIKTIPYTKSARPDDTKWSEKVTLTLNQSAPLKIEVSTTKKETAELEQTITVTGATETTTPTVSTETSATTTQEASGDLGITFWVFVFVVVIVIVGAIVYVRRKKKGMM